MDEKRKQTIKESIDFVETLPEKYQEIVLKYLLESSNSVNKDTDREDIEKNGSTVKRITLSLNVKAFLQRENLPEEIISKIFVISDGGIFDAYKIPADESKAKSQVRIALLTALKNALLKNSFAFNIEEVRELCNTHSVYDTNFSKLLSRNSNYFKDTKDKTSIELNSEGLSALAEFLEENT